MKKRLAHHAVKTKKWYLRNNAETTHKFWDKLIFNKVKQAFGGDVRVMVTAAAPISMDVIDFLKVVSTSPILEGYGQTESTGASFLTKKKDPLSGHVGGPLVCTEFKVMA